MSPRYGGGASGDTCGRAQADRASAREATTRLPLVVIDPTVRLDEPHDALLVELVQAVQPGPGREGEPALHRGVWGQDHVLVVLAHDPAQLLGQVGALAVVLDDHAAVLEVVHLQLWRDRPRVEAPGRDVRQVRSRRRRIGVVGLVGVRGRLDMLVAEVGELLTRLVGRRLVREPRDGGRDHDDADDRGARGHPLSSGLAAPPVRLRPPLLSRHAPRSCDGGSVWWAYPTR